MQFTSQQSSRLGIGIDFGTSNSAAAVFDGEQITLIKLAAPDSVMPSANYINKGFKSSIGGVVKSFKSLKFAIIASGIGALLLIITSIVTAFKNSEAGQNKFAKLMGVIGSVVGNVVDVLADLGMFIIDLFSGDGDALKALVSFGKKIFDVIGLPLKTVIDTVKALGRVMSALFSGDVSGAVPLPATGIDRPGPQPARRGHGTGCDGFGGHSTGHHDDHDCCHRAGNRR